MIRPRDGLLHKQQPPPSQATTRGANERPVMEVVGTASRKDRARLFAWAPPASGFTAEGSPAAALPPVPGCLGEIDRRAEDPSTSQSKKTTPPRPPMVLRAHDERTEVFRKPECEVEHCFREWATRAMRSLNRSWISLPVAMTQWGGHSAAALSIDIQLVFILLCDECACRHFFASSSFPHCS